MGAFSQLAPKVGVSPHGHLCRLAWVPSLPCRACAGAHTLSAAPVTCATGDAGEGSPSRQ